MVKTNTNTKLVSQTSHFYPPVVAVLGHVDHGKTTLLDAVRKTNIAAKEHGGITQSIGVSTVEFISEGRKRRITFIDTPGHVAFMRMRGRGVQAADIGLLVVSSTDGVMPQTKESIKLLKDSKIPFIAVLTKSDLHDKNPEKVKQQLLKEDVMLDRFGGDVPVIEVSAKADTNIRELLELILLVFELKRENYSIENDEFKAIVIESRLDQKSGPRATIVIKSGSVLVRDDVKTERSKARVRTIISDQGEHLNKASVGEAVEIFGFETVPDVGSIVTKRHSGKPVSRREHPESPDTKRDSGLARMTDLQPSPKEGLSIVLCADTLGSLEAIVNALPKEILVVLQKTGEVSPADILFAKSVGAIVIGFNIKVRNEIVKLASLEKVLFKNYTIIYELMDEINDVLKGKQLKVEEEIFGKAKVLASFPYEKTKVLGIDILEGRVARGDKARLIRKEEVLGESVVSSVRVGKNTISKVEKGHEAGIILSPFLDFAIGDMLIFHG